MSNVIDANCWKLFIDEKMAEVEDIGHKLFGVAATSGGILFDDGNIVRQQYIDLKKPYSEQLFDIWFEECVTMGSVHLIEVPNSANIVRELKALGVPKVEYVYFKLAIAGSANYIVSIDVDFFDPTMKMAGSKKKLSIISKGVGPVCKHMKKVHGVYISCPEAFVAAHTGS